MGPDTGTILCTNVTSSTPVSMAGCAIFNPSKTVNFDLFTIKLLQLNIHVKISEKKLILVTEC